MQTGASRLPLIDMGIEAVTAFWQILPFFCSCVPWAHREGRGPSIAGQAAFLMQSEYTALKR